MTAKKKEKPYLLKKLEASTKANKLKRKKSEIVIHCCGFNHEGECDIRCQDHGGHL